MDEGFEDTVDEAVLKWWGDYGKGETDGKAYRALVQTVSGLIAKHSKKKSKKIYRMSYTCSSVKNAAKTLETVNPEELLGVLKDHVGYDVDSLSINIFYGK